jgi:hypothetical protein
MLDEMVQLDKLLVKRLGTQEALNTTSHKGGSKAAGAGAGADSFLVDKVWFWFVDSVHCFF